VILLITTLGKFGIFYDITDHERHGFLPIISIYHQFDQISFRLRKDNHRKAYSHNGNDMSNNDTDTKNYWFRAQRYGWGWGLPLTRQGWIIVIAYTVIIIAGIFIFPLNEKKALFICWLVGFTIMLLVICWIKGEPPRWRWGKDKDTS